MAFTTKAPWLERELSESEMRQVMLDQISDKVCWQVGKYLGSMLYMDFGGIIQIRPGVSKRAIQVGEAMLGIRDCFWRLADGSRVIVDSESITDDNAAEKLKYLEGVFLRNFLVRESNMVDLVFSNHVVLSLDTSNQYEAEDHIAEFVAPNGRIYTIGPGGAFSLSDEVDTARFVR
ncbi:MAG: hypothetical protein KA757_08320 [Vogesella sp.]|nr:hypothetical protein [Vogesella sp.]